MDSKSIRKRNLLNLLNKYTIENKATRADFAQKCGLSPAMLSQLTGDNAVRNIGDKLARKIEEMNNLSMGWMDVDHEKRKHHPDSTIPPESEWVGVDAWDSSTPLPNDEVEVPFLRDIEFACGNGRITDEDYNGFKLRFSKATLRRVGAKTDGSGVLCFPARGNSMEPVIPDGATVAVDTDNKRIIDGQLYAINQDGFKRIKQLYRRPGGKLEIRSFNRDEHPDEMVDESEVEIVGFVFWYSVLIYTR